MIYFLNFIKKYNYISIKELIFGQNLVTKLVIA